MRSARKSHGGSAGGRLRRASYSPADPHTGDELYFYTRGGQAAASGMKGRNEMSRRICSGWFDTRQVLARVQTRSSGFPATSWWASLSPTAPEQDLILRSQRTESKKKKKVCRDPREMRINLNGERQDGDSRSQQKMTGRFVLKHYIIWYFGEDDAEVSNTLHSQRMTHT